MDDDSPSSSTGPPLKYGRYVALAAVGAAALTVGAFAYVNGPKTKTDPLSGLSMHKMMLIKTGLMGYSALHEDEVKTLFHTFKATYQKDYIDEAEDDKRLKHFQAYLTRVDERNTKEREAGGTAVHGLTKFADMSHSEFKEKMLGYRKPEGKTAVLKKTATVDKYTGDLKKVDWTGVYSGDPRDQGYCASCWAFSASEQVESDAVRAGLLTYGTTLSAQQLVSCDTTANNVMTQNLGCDGGYTEGAFDYIRETGGLVAENKYPYGTSYNGNTGACRLDGTAAYLVTVDDYYTVADEDAMVDYVLSTGPLSACVDASDWDSYQSGTVSSCGNEVNHCVQIVGVHTTKKWWKVRNSWGMDWGDDGYIYLKSGKNMCGLLDDPIFVTVAPAAAGVITDSAAEAGTEGSEGSEVAVTAHDKQGKKDKKEKKADTADVITPHAGPVKPLPDTATDAADATDAARGAVGAKALRGNDEAAGATVGMGKAPPASIALKGQAHFHAAPTQTAPAGADKKLPLDPPARPTAVGATTAATTTATNGALRASRPQPAVPAVSASEASPPAGEEVPSSPLSGAGRAPGLGASQAAKGQAAAATAATGAMKSAGKAPAPLDKVIKVKDDVVKAPVDAVAAVDAATDAAAGTDADGAAATAATTTEEVSTTDATADAAPAASTVVAVPSGGGKAPAPLDKRTKVQTGTTGTAGMMHSSGKDAAAVPVGLPKKAAKEVKREVGKAARLEAEAAALQAKAATQAAVLEGKASDKFLKAQQLKASALLTAQEARQAVGVV